MQVLKWSSLRLFITISFTKDERRLFQSIRWLWWAILWTTIRAWVWFVCLFKLKSVDQFNPPEQPQILDNGDLKQQDAVMKRPRSLAKWLFNCSHVSPITDPIWIGILWMTAASSWPRCVAYSTADKCKFQYKCAKNGKGLKIGTKEADTT